jgi:AcrR family transcriptional regulator
MVDPTRKRALNDRGQTPSPGEARHVGRPRDPALELRVLKATLDLIVEGGLGAATIDAVAERSGVGRATLYRRWADREALIEAAIRHALGRPPIARSGDLAADIQLGARQTRAFTNQPLFLAVFPEIVREVLRTESRATTGRGPAGRTYDAIFPGRRVIAEEYGELAAAAGFRTDVDPYVVVDLIVGALISHLVATGHGPSAAFTDQVVDVVLTGLRAGD